MNDDPSLFPNRERLCLFVPNYKTGLTEGNIKKILLIIKRHSLGEGRASPILVRSKTPPPWNLQPFEADVLHGYFIYRCS